MDPTIFSTPAAPLTGHDLRQMIDDIPETIVQAGV